MSDQTARRPFSLQLALLTLVVVADVALTSALGTACGSGALCGPGDGRAQPARLARYLREVWPQQAYLPGESSADLWALSLVRAVASLLLAASMVSSVRATRRAAAPELLLPLQAAEAQNSSAAPANASDGASGISGEAPATPPLTTTRARWRQLLPSPLTWSLVLLSVTGTFLSAKAFSRLLQSGVGGPGSGALPLEGTTPQEPWWWAALIAGAASALCQHAALASLSRAQHTDRGRTAPTGIGAGGRESRRHAGTRAGGIGGAKVEEDPMLGVKKAYLDASMPQVQTHCFLFDSVPFFGGGLGVKKAYLDASMPHIQPHCFLFSTAPLFLARSRRLTSTLPSRTSSRRTSKAVYFNPTARPLSGQKDATACSRDRANTKLGVNGLGGCRSPHHGIPLHPFQVKHATQPPLPLHIALHSRAFPKSSHATADPLGAHTQPGAGSTEADERIHPSLFYISHVRATVTRSPRHNQDAV